MAAVSTASMQGWLHIKIRSTVNVRPRHHRFCILADRILHTFKFQPPLDSEKTIRPVRSYAIQHIEDYRTSRKFSFLVTAVLLADNSVRVLEVDAASKDLKDIWTAMLMQSYSTLKSYGSSLPPTNNDSSATSPPKTLVSPPPEIFTRNIGDASTSMIKMGASIHRGLENSKGENNCFLNVIIQSFWHLTSMRRLLLRLNIKSEQHSGVNVMSALKDIMIAYQEPDSGDLHPGALRKGLCDLYSADKMFAEGAMEDAEETLLTLLNLMHRQTVFMELKEDERLKMLKTPHVDRLRSESFQHESASVFDPKSIPHIVFSHQICDRTICSVCKRKSDWDLFSNLVFTVHAHELTSSSYTSFEITLRNLASKMDIYGSCRESSCEGKLMVERVIRRFPMVFAISVMWATNSPSKDELKTLLNLLSERLDLAQAFTASGNNKEEIGKGGKKTTYKFRGIVCYYGQHYFAFFYSTAHKQWLLFDDHKVTLVGPWDHVVDKCMKGRYQPVLIFYELPDKRKDSSVGLFDGPTSNSSVKSIKYSVLDQVKESSDSEGDSKLSSEATSKETSEAQDHASNQEDIGENPIQTASKNLKDESPETESMEKGKSNAVENVNSALSNTGKAMLVDGLSPSSSKKSISSKTTPTYAPVASSVAMQPRVSAMNKPLEEGEYKVKFGSDKAFLGLFLEKHGNNLVVTQFPRGPNGEIFAAEESKEIDQFDCLIDANGHPLSHYTVDRAIQMIQAQSRPLVLRMRKSAGVKQLVDMGFSTDLARKALMHSRGNIQAAANYCFENSK